jgi:L-malate glycosyltransferase
VTRAAVPHQLPAVLHIDTERGWRGGERQVLWLAEALARRGYGSQIAARPGEPLAERARASGLSVIPCAPRSEFALLTARALRRTIRRDRIDIVHAHTGHAVALAALAVRGTSAAMVLTRRVDFRLRPNPVTRWKYSRADAIIAISSAVAEALVMSGIPPDRITIIPSGVDLSRRLEAASPATLATLGVGDAQPLVVMVAALVQHKDPLNFVRAIAETHRRCPGARALLVGDGPLRAAVEAEIARRGLSEVLRMTGTRLDADALLAAADIAVLSSEEEGLGTVLLDAMSVGRPVAATRAGGIPEIVRHGEDGVLVPIHDPIALGGAIAQIAQNGELAQRLGENGRRRAAEFSVENTADQTVGVYARTLAQRRGERA